MSIFGSILSKIFGSHTAAAATPAAAPAATPAAAPAAAAPAAAPAAPAQPVDVDAVLSALAAKNPEKLNWQTSIVDLLKLLGLDSSLAARKELATELHYTGDMNDSASMNVWLIKQVMQKLAANGGKVSPDLMK
ncbi:MULTISPECIES: DUF3597 domain-containing protein [Komagataeibacter]|uniref:DUF3597 domain-containing protein n=2 Tax=Komagataeibacter TaxID=1434011 RepID=A0A0D6Q6Q3_KOMXY|nr:MULTISPECIES: DUF3597 domain-containing protein [Komagataeibacter]MBL7232387.1 DUF3597 domain-containing protein [Komagataeibacter oboediens]MBT0674666.1 DUF3597 domain-containing protein [Komagataeibacter oboediens]MBT0677558.1 DUF3597 domain-containing protein [Komagataeibacter oboediens]MBV0887437.1 DUF3597 domain-containing protein [Komagataeibacter oboediens]MBV1824475.1 DUF3597 domain-containing protein [Komagataeibacter oboediens]